MVDPELDRPARGRDRSAPDRNQAVFDHERVANSYVQFTGAAGGFLNGGEAAALIRVAPSCRGVPILDIGVGSGRTTALLQLMSDRYVAADYAPNMIEAFSTLFPHLPAHVADARDLHMFDAGQFGLVVFSNNGIDTVAHDERTRVLLEFARVLTASGTLVFSTLNRGGMSFRENPFQLKRPTTSWTFAPRKWIMNSGRRLLDPAGIWRGIVNWLGNRSHTSDHGTWALAPLAAHDYALVMHFTTLTDIRELAAETGFEIVSIFADYGAEIAPAATESGADNFTVVARRSSGRGHLGPVS